MSMSVFERLVADPASAVDTLEAAGYSLHEHTSAYGERRYLFKKDPSDFFGIYIEAPGLVLDTAKAQ